MIGSRERRPSASRMPSGSEQMMPVNEITRVTSSPPQRRVSTCGSPNTPPTSRKKATTGKTPKNRIALQRLVGDARDEQRHQQDDAERVGQVDPPAARCRIEAVHELGEFGRDERPAGADLAADRLRQAIDAARSRPHRVDEQELDRRPDQRGKMTALTQRQHGVEHAAEQALRSPRRAAPPLATGGGSGPASARRTKDGLRSRRHQRSATRIRALYQFISALVTSEIAR